MRALAGLLAAGLFLALCSMECKAGDVKDYLTADGKLKEKLTLSVVHHADNAGRVTSTRTWTIEPSGEWKLMKSGINFGIRAEKPSLVAKGTLTKQQLAALGQHLATQELKKLTDELGAAPADKPFVSAAINFGKKKTTLKASGMSFTEALPKAGDAKANDWSRFVAVALLVRHVMPEPVPVTKKKE
jgi:hypothetical protein